MEFDDVRAHAARLSPWCHVATVRRDGSPHVVPVDLDLFAPGGPEGSPETGFLAIEPARAAFLELYGIKGRSAWRA